MLTSLWTEAYKVWKEFQCFGRWWKCQPIFWSIYLLLNADITLPWGLQCLEGVAMLWNVASRNKWHQFFRVSRTHLVDWPKLRWLRACQLSNICWPWHPFFLFSHTIWMVPSCSSLFEKAHLISLRAVKQRLTPSSTLRHPWWINDISFNTGHQKSSEKAAITNQPCIPLKKSCNVAIL